MAASVKKQMWRKLKTVSPRSLLKYVFNPHFCLPTMAILFIAELVVSIFVINKIKYTEIDWVAYMQEVEGFINGTYDYTLLKGDTGPLVYPAGFVYIFTALYYVTDHGKNILLAQYIFAGLYLLTLLVIFDIYRRGNRVPPFVFFFMCCASYRIHSIYILRMFNDPVAMLFLYIAVDCFLTDKWSLGCLFYSLGVSVKMNVMLFAPALLVLLLVSHGPIGTVKNLIICAIPQIVLAVPFLLENPVGYIVMSFNFGRQFFYKWTVNWRLLPEEIFLNRQFQLCLLLLHVTVLLVFIFMKWKSYMSRRPVHLSMLSWTFFYQYSTQFLPQFNLGNFRRPNIHLTPNQILLPLFTANFIGMCFSRSLHYQFYVWYFHALHYLLWSTNLPNVVSDYIISRHKGGWIMLLFALLSLQKKTPRILVLGVIELCWNTYPSTVLSSSVLHFCHFVVLVGLWYCPDYTPVRKKIEAKKMH